MSHRSFFIGVIVLVLLFSASARSQGPTSSAGSDESAAQKKKATDLLLTVAGQVDSLRSAQNRARIGSNAADALWEHDEKRARSLFAAVGEDIRTGFADADTDFEKHNHTLEVFWQLRSDTLGRIAKHDPELALEFLRATRLPPNTGLPAYLTDETEKSQELRLAGQVAAKKPELALKLGRESLAQGFSSDLFAMLATLQSSNKAASVSFYQAIVDKLKDTDLAQDAGATRFAFELANQFLPPQTDESIYRELIGVLLAGALANGCGKPTGEDDTEICYEIGSVFPRLEKYYGVRAAPLKRWMREAEGPDVPQYEIWSQARQVAENGTVDEILAFVEKNPGTKYELYRSAVWKAEATGDFARARQIASDYPNEEMRPAMIAEIDLQQKRFSTNPNNPASIQQALSTFHNDEERIGFLLESAGRIGANDRKAALAFLNQASQIVDSTKGKTQLGGQVGLALMYCTLKSNRGLSIVESLMPRLNQLVAAAAALDGIENNYLSDEEWNMTGAGTLGGLLTALGQNAGCFARLDFDRSVALANQLERPELRLMAELKIAQGILTDQPGPLLMFRETYRPIY
ncbi:MAG: hypothetical protein ABJA18_10440 [bacterium]